MNLAWDHWHIELSSICTLKCPRCPRAEVPDSLLNRQLTLSFLKIKLVLMLYNKYVKLHFVAMTGIQFTVKNF